MRRKNRDEAVLCSMCGVKLSKSAEASAGPVSAPGVTISPMAARQAGGATIAPPPRPIQRRPMQQASVLENAGFWLRVVAALLDGIITGIVIGPLLFGFGFAGAIMAFMMGNIGAAIKTIALCSVASIAIQYLYKVLMESSPTQGTLGKMILGLKVTDLNGDRISIGRATGRFLALSGIGMAISGIGVAISSKIVANIGSLYSLISCIVVAFTEEKQGLHDMMAGTLVVRK